MINKRFFDMFLCLSLIPIAIPICVFFAILVFAECRASPFFIQTRLGFREKPFRLLKLRSMRPGTRNVASHMVDRTSILKIGRFIRATKVDELPQLWNVMRGEMSFVGPRPGLFNQDELIKYRRQYRVYDLLPGITGIGQISGLDMSEPAELARHDAMYLGPWSARLDISILIKTFTGSGMGDAALTNRRRDK